MSLRNILFKNYRFILVVYVLLAVISSTQSIMLGRKPENAHRHPYFKYNNYMIFKQSYAHMVERKDLYKAYPCDYEDLYKYSPTFALSFGIFSKIPDVFGLTIWNLLNSLVLFFSFLYLPNLDMKRKILMLMVIALELMTSLQNSQANGLMAGLIIFTFGLLERRHYLLACFCLISMVYIKIFGVLALAFFLFYPQKWKLIGYSLIWFFIFLFAPLLVIGFGELQFHYIRWFKLLQSDYSVSSGISAIGLVYAWFGLNLDKLIFIISGFIILMLPYLNIRKYREFSFRILALASILIWVVIFNHKAESPTFIIALSGVALWSLSLDLKKWKISLLVFAIILTSLSTSDLFPKSFRDDFLVPYVIKVVPCLLIWTIIIFEMIFFKDKLSTKPDLNTG